jgi:hypothetical protein
MSVFKRYSTYANFLCLGVSAGMSLLGAFNMDADTVAGIMLGGNIVIAICQFIKQKAAGV